MTASNVARSRRGFLGALLGAAAAGVAGVLGRPAPVRGGTGYVQLGQHNDSGGDTIITLVSEHGEAIVGSGPDAGVVGQSKKRGVWGTAIGTGTGVEGRADAGGVGVVAASTAVGGMALSVKGHASFATSGSRSFAIGQQKVSLTYPRSRRSVVVATLNGSAGSGITVQYVLPTSGGFSIVLTAPAQIACRVAYFVIEGSTSA
jgi:hypothetical protein